MNMIDGIQPNRRPADPKKAPKITLPEPSEPAFRPPEAVAAAEATPPKHITEPLTPKRFDTAKGGKRSAKFNIVEKFKHLSKKQKIITIAIVVVVLAGLGGGAYALFKKPAPKPAPVVV